MTKIHKMQVLLIKYNYILPINHKTNENIKYNILCSLNNKKVE